MLLFYLPVIGNEEQRDLFTSLYNDYKDFLFHIANYILEDTLADENTVHEVFLRIIENPDKYDLNDYHKKKGLFGIMVRGIAIDEYRRRKRIDLREEFPEVPSEDLSVDEEAIAAEQYDKLLELIGKLDSIYADILRLKYYFDLSNPEISASLGLTDATVRQRLSRGRQKLKEQLVKEGGYLDQ